MDCTLAYTSCAMDVSVPSEADRLAMCKSLWLEWHRHPHYFNRFDGKLDRPFAGQLVKTAT